MARNTSGFIIDLKQRPVLQGRDKDVWVRLFFTEEPDALWKAMYGTVAFRAPSSRTTVEGDTLVVSVSVENAGSLVTGAIDRALDHVREINAQWVQAQGQIEAAEQAIDVWWQRKQG